MFSPISLQALCRLFNASHNWPTTHAGTQLGR
jgi:hypothetical protein